MTSFNHNKLHLSGWHVLASSWQDYPKKWPKLPYKVQQSDHRDQHARLVWTDVRNKNKMVTSIALIGGWNETQGHDQTTSSVYILRNAFSVHADNRWQNGPNLNVHRCLMAASVCNGYVYVMGGYQRRMCLDTIERIPVSHLFNDHQHDGTSSWTMLSTCLSKPRRKCAAVAIHDRFIVVVGGEALNYYLQSVDIIDTMTPPPVTTNLDNSLRYADHHTVVTVCEETELCGYGRQGGGDAIQLSNTALCAW